MSVIFTSGNIRRLLQDLLQQLTTLQVQAAEFSCTGRVTGYYADISSDCRLYHVCDSGKHQFTHSCPNATKFQQRMMICDHEYLVDCSGSEKDYSANLLIGQKGVPFLSAAEFLKKQVPQRRRDRTTPRSAAINDAFSTTQKPHSTHPHTTRIPFYLKTTTTHIRFPSTRFSFSTTPRPTNSFTNSLPYHSFTTTPRPTSFSNSPTYQSTTTTTPQPTSFSNSPTYQSIATTPRTTQYPIGPTYQSFAITPRTTQYAFGPTYHSSTPKTTTNSRPLAFSTTSTTIHSPQSHFKPLSHPTPHPSNSGVPTIFPYNINDLAFPPSRDPASPAPVQEAPEPNPPKYGTLPHGPDPLFEIYQSQSVEPFAARRLDSQAPVLVDDNYLESRSLKVPGHRLEWTLPDTRAMLYIPDTPEEAVAPNIKRYSITIPESKMGFKKSSEKPVTENCPDFCHPAFRLHGSCQPCVMIK